MTLDKPLKPSDKGDNNLQNAMKEINELRVQGDRKKESDTSDTIKQPERTDAQALAAANELMDRVSRNPDLVKKLQELIRTDDKFRDMLS
jgi:hypothetical protein